MHAVNKTKASVRQSVCHFRQLSHLAHPRTVADEEPRPFSFRQQVGVALSRVQDLREVERAVAPLHLIRPYYYEYPFPAISSHVGDVGDTILRYTFIDG